MIIEGKLHVLQAFFSNRQFYFFHIFLFQRSIVNSKNRFLQWSRSRWRFWGRTRSYRQGRHMTWSVRAPARGRRRFWLGGSHRSSWRDRRKTWVMSRSPLRLRGRRKNVSRSNEAVASRLIASPLLNRCFEIRETFSRLHKSTLLYYVD